MNTKGNYKYEYYKEKYRYTPYFLIGSAYESEGFYIALTKYQIIFSFSYIAIFIAATYTNLFGFYDFVFSKYGNFIFEEIPIIVDRFDTLERFNPLFSKWYLMSFIMLFPSIIILSIIYAIIYRHYWRIGSIKNRMTPLHVIGAIFYPVVIFFFFYLTFCLTPSPSYHSARFAYSTLFGPLFPFVAALASISFPVGVLPLIAILIRLTVRRQNLVKI
ncbi:hypothetical protein [Roseibium sp. RKSG952]|uniref:hypothetical protein n=1 Tax=Roseibium sp. RKSG952 TaxID=2529384 RepID=UPI0012BB9DEE|nr:hypothetical protein [Roseibium sp. RKSG952]MTH94819.1 hypothetical protein [Roseibium sp. RKSG952]